MACGKEDFLAVIDGMDMDVAEDIVAPDLRTLDLYCDRVASAVGRLSIKVFGMEEGPGFALAHHLGRALQLTNILRDIDEDAAIGRLYLPREYLIAAGVTSTDPNGRDRRSAQSTRSAGASRATGACPLRKGGSGSRQPNPRGASRTPRLMGAVYWRNPCARRSRGLDTAAPPRPPQQVQMALHRAAARPRSDEHGLCRRRRAWRAFPPLSCWRKRRASVELVRGGAGRRAGAAAPISIPRSGSVIDNGNHLVLSGNHCVRSYLHSIGADSALVGPDRAEFDFADLASGAKWTIRPNEGPFAVVDFFIARGAFPIPAPCDYLALLRLLLAGPDKRISDVIRCKGPLWDRLLQPFLLAALNTEPGNASAALAGAVMRETLAKGGHAYRPRIAHPTLAAAFVDPALEFLKRKACERAVRSTRPRGRYVRRVAPLGVAISRRRDCRSSLKATR